MRHSAKAQKSTGSDSCWEANRVVNAISSGAGGGAEVPMSAERPKVIVTKKNISVEPRRSNSLTDAHLRDLRNGVVTASRISTFYHNHIEKARLEGRLPMIMQRDAVQILTQMRGQKVYVCEQPHDDERVIYAASMLWDEEIPVPQRNADNRYNVERFLEIGTQVSELPGYSLQWLLTAIILLEQLLYDSTGTVYAATYGDNEVAGPNFTKNMHFVPWAHVPETVMALRLHHLDSAGELARGVKWFRPTLRTVEGAANLIVDVHQNPSRNAKATGAPVPEIELRFDENEFQKVSYKELLELAHALIKNPPKSYSELKEFSSRTLSPTFLDFEGR